MTISMVLAFIALILAIIFAVLGTLPLPIAGMFALLALAIILSNYRF